MMARSKTLQSKAGYIDARPLTTRSTNSLATHGRTIHWANIGLLIVQCMEAKGIVVRDRAKKSRLLPHDLLLRSRVTASIVRSTISDPKRSLRDGDHVRAFLLYRL